MMQSSITVRRRRLPRLHVITDDHILARPNFVQAARALLALDAALHIRSRDTPAATLFQIADQLADNPQGLLVINDRIDIALCTASGAVQLGVRSLPISAALALAGERLIGYSAHSAQEAGRAQADGADFILAGTIYRSDSHPGAPPAGPALITEAAAVCTIPVIAIGGVTPERVAEALAAGAQGVAAIRGIWSAPDPVHAAEEFVKLLER